MRTHVRLLPQSHRGPHRTYRGDAQGVRVPRAPSRDDRTGGLPGGRRDQLPAAVRTVGRVLGRRRSPAPAPNRPIGAGAPARLTAGTSRGLPDPGPIAHSSSRRRRATPSALSRALPLNLPGPAPRAATQGHEHGQGVPPGPTRAPRRRSAKTIRASLWSQRRAAAETCPRASSASPERRRRRDAAATRPAGAREGRPPASRTLSFPRPSGSEAQRTALVANVPLSGPLTTQLPAGCRAPGTTRRDRRWRARPYSRGVRGNPRLTAHR